MHKRCDQAITINIIKQHNNNHHNNNNHHYKIITIIIIIMFMLILKHNNSKILGMILTRLITNPSMSLSNKNQIFNPNMILTIINIRKNISSIILLIVLDIKVTLDMILGRSKRPNITLGTIITT